MAEKASEQPKKPDKPKPDKPIVWLDGPPQSPPLSEEAQDEAGYLLRKLQKGESIGMPHSKPLPKVAARLHELRINDEDVTWRIFYRIDDDAIVVVLIDPKKSTQGIKTPKKVLDKVRKRLKDYDQLAGGK